MAPVTTYVPDAGTIARNQVEATELQAERDRRAAEVKVRELAELDRLIAWYRAQAAAEYGSY